MEFSDLIISQAKALMVMFCAGILTEMLWRVKCFAKSRLSHRAAGAVVEFAFWICSAMVISMFMYYATYGKPTIYSAIGFLAGFLLWKKICCVILK